MLTTETRDGVPVVPKVIPVADVALIVAQLVQSTLRMYENVNCQNSLDECVGIVCTEAGHPNLTTPIWLLIEHSLGDARQWSYGLSGE